MSLEELSFAGYSVLLTVAFVAGVIRSFSGFGSGLLMAPVFSLMMPPIEVLVLVLLLDEITSLQLLRGALGTVLWPLVFRLLLPSLVGVPLGLLVIRFLDPLLLRQIVAASVIVVAVIMLAGWRYDGRRGVFQDSATGLVSGVMTSIAGIGGPPIILYLLSDRRLTHTTFRAVCILYFFFVETATLVPLGVSGSITYQMILSVLILLPGYILANWLGTVLLRSSFGRLEARARKVSLILLLVVGTVILAV